jgi:multicomponent K+:H+ antiporter subunit A
MVKAGVFLMIRLWPALAGTDEWTWLLGTAGVCTLLLGVVLFGASGYGRGRGRY